MTPPGPEPSRPSSGPDRRPEGEGGASTRSQGHPPHATDTVPETDRGKNGFAVPGYEIGDRLGGGGMGEVYAAREVELNREVAIKFVRPDLAAAAEALRRFETEARITAGMPHPSVPPIHAYGRLPDGRPYLVMKRIDGRTLHDLLRERADPAADFPRFVQIFEQVCQAAGFTHDHRVIHRDLKPGNVMVGAFGEVQVMDWGLAKRLPASGAAVLASDPSLTVFGRALGTLDYMPPEQAEGDWDQVDARADVFALGAILCAILAGDSPYVLGAVPGHPDPTRPARLARGVERLRGCGRDPELIALAADCLASNPAARPADGRAVARRVEAFREGVAVRLRTVEVEKAVAVEVARKEGEAAVAAKEAEIAAIKDRAKEARRRRRRLARTGVAAALALALLAAGGYVWWQEREVAGADRVARAGEEKYEAGTSRRDAIDDFKAARDKYTGVLAGPVVWNTGRRQLALARVYTWLGKLYEEERDPGAAAAALGAAEKLLDELRESGGRPEYDLALAEVHHNWGIHYGNKADHRTALKSYDKGRSLRANVPESVQRDRKNRQDLARSYGYLGDAQINTGDFGGAERSYADAKGLRADLANEHPEPETHCLHARDYQNEGNLAARQGERAEAIKKYRQRLAYYNKYLPGFPARLPGEYKSERADTNCDIAELELDQPQPAGNTQDFIAAARREYEMLRSAHDGADVRSGFARVLLCEARAYHRAGKSDERDEKAAEAADILSRLGDDGNAQPGDYYNLAVAYALLGGGQSGDAPFNRFRALDRLHTAVRKGFIDHQRLRHDFCLGAIFENDPEFAKVLKATAEKAARLQGKAP